jgi:competence protein ComEC
MSPALSRSFDPLRFRPLLWMALAALLGVALGTSGPIASGTRSDLFLWLPWLPALACAVGSILNWRHGIWRRALIAGLVTCFFTAASARRVLPPIGDISELSRVALPHDGPIEPVLVTVQGTVADYPSRGDFNLQFPLECTSPRGGRIWMRVPYGTAVEIGDQVETELLLEALPRAGNWGERESQWRFIGDSCWCLSAKQPSWKKLGVDESYRMARRIAGFRAALLEHYEVAFRGDGEPSTLRSRPFPAATAQLMTAMVFGEGGLSRPLPRLLRDDFRAAGLSHLLVASGTQTSFLLLLLLGLSRLLRFKRIPIWLVVVPILVFYAMLAGGAASIWRATLGGALFAWALHLGRDVDALSLWSAALLALLVLDPLSAYSLSFQLTFAATWGLIVVGPVLKRALESRFGPFKLGEAAAYSLAAQTATLPISLFHFGSFSAAGLGANFVAVPLAGLMVLTGLLGLVAPINWINYYLSRGAVEVAHGFAVLPGASLSGTPISLGATWVYSGAVLLALAPLSLDWKPLWDEHSAKWRVRWDGFKPTPYHLAGVLVALGLALLYLAYGTKPRDLEVTMLDVGQGESILVRTPSGQNMLIDGGSLSGRERSDIGAAVLVPALQRLGISHLDLLVTTHTDADHCNGLAALAREIPIDAFLDGAAAAGTRPDPAQTDYWELLKVLQSQKVPQLAPRAGQSFQLGAAKLQILAPTYPLLDSTNNNCLVMRLDYGQTSFLFTGDIEAPAEQRLLERGANLKCTVLKVAHHGSKSSTSPRFLSAANPQIALISCGRYNRYGHPNAEPLRELNNNRTATFRTDVNGAIEVDCSVSACWVKPFR